MTKRLHLRETIQKQKRGGNNEKAEKYPSNTGCPKCGLIYQDGVWKHIERVIPTIKISPVGGGDMLYIEPVEGRQNQYHIVHPPEFFCWVVPITGPIVQECEVVVVDSGPHAGEWHIEEIDTNVETNGGSPVGDSTWTKIKSFFRDLFN